MNIKKLIEIHDEAEAFIINNKKNNDRPIVRELILGLTEGDTCNRSDCKGKIYRVDDGGECSCHINPPCNYCVNPDAIYCCNSCDWSSEDETDNE